MSQTEVGQVTRTPALRMQIAIAFLAFILIGANDGATGVLIPSLQAQYGVNKATIGMLIIWLIPINAAAAIGLCFTGFCLGPIFPTTIGLMSQILSSRLLASAIGFMASLGSMGGALFPWLAGNLAQAFGLWTLLPYVITLAVVMMVIWFILQRPQPSHSTI